MAATGEEIADRIRVDHRGFHRVVSTNMVSGGIERAKQRETVLDDTPVARSGLRSVDAKSCTHSHRNVLRYSGMRRGSLRPHSVAFLGTQVRRAAAIKKPSLFPPPAEENHVDFQNASALSSNPRLYLRGVFWYHLAAWAPPHGTIPRRRVDSCLSTETVGLRC